jgi:DNA-binding response OmpR family regulator
MARLLLLEDETALREEMAAYLGKCGHTVEQAGTLAEFWPLMANAELAILDLMLPDGSGLDAVARLRVERPRVGIIILTALGTTRDKVAGLRGGADHYLVKPFRPLELAATIAALLRRLGAGWRLDLLRRQLIDPAGFVGALSSHEMCLFSLLAERPGQVVTRRCLVESFGADWVHYDLRRLDTLVSRLRRRWRAAGGQDLPIKTAYGEGYSFGESITLV